MTTSNRFSRPLCAWSPPIKWAPVSQTTASKEGLVLTSQHVVDNNTIVTVQMNNGASYQGSVAVSDADRDLAVIKLPENPSGYPFAAIGNSGRNQTPEIEQPGPDSRLPCRDRHPARNCDYRHPLRLPADAVCQLSAERSRKYSPAAAADR